MIDKGTFNSEKTYKSLLYVHNNITLIGNEKVGAIISDFNEKMKKIDDEIKSETLVQLLKKPIIVNYSDRLHRQCSDPLMISHCLNYMKGRFKNKFKNI